MNPIPQFASDLLATCPTSGEGVHNWLFRAARVLHHCRPLEEIEALLEAASHGCGRSVPAREIQAAVRDSKACEYVPGQSQRMSTKGFARGKPSLVAPPRGWPKRNAQVVDAICADGWGLADLWEASPVRLEDNQPNTEAIIDWLFPGNPLLCVGASMRHFDTRRRDDWRGRLHRKQLIVPSPMKAKTGTAKAGHPSAHTLDNTGPRRFLVVEFDEGTFDKHAAVLWHLAGLAPLVLVVMSGNKSLHGWFWVDGCNEGKLRRFMEYATAHGADPATWTRSQFVRMPDGARDNGNRQAVLFFNPLSIQQT